MCVYGELEQRRRKKRDDMTPAANEAQDFTRPPRKTARKPCGNGRISVSEI